MSLTILAAAPLTTRGLPTQLSADSKGERIAYVSGKSVFLRKIDDPAVSKQYTEHTAQATVARFSPSGFYIASGDVTGNVRVWDSVEAKVTKGEYPIIAGRINDIAWDADSQRIIAVGDGKGRFGHCFSYDSGNSVGEISGHSSQINSASIRPVRPYRAATGSDDMTMAFYHGPPFKFNTSVRGNHTKYIYGTAFSPDGAYLVTVGGDRKICVYDAKTGEFTKTIGQDEHKGSIFGVSWSPDSKSFATASADQTVKVWDVETGKVTHTWRIGGEEGSVSVPDQQMGVLWPQGRTDGLVISISLAGNLNYLHTSSSTPTKILRGHNGNITAAGLSADGQTFFTGGFDGRVLAWDIKTGAASALDGEQHSSYVSGFTSITGSAPRTFSVGWDDTLRTIDSATKTFTGTAIKLSGQPKAIASNSAQLIIATPAGLDIYAADSGTKIGSLATKDYSATVLASNGNIVATGNDDKSVRIYTLKASGSSAELMLTKTVANTCQSSISQLAFSPDGSLLAAGSNGGGISVVKVKDGSIVTTRWSAHTGRVTGLAWRSDGKGAASCSLDTNVHVWSLEKPGKRIKIGHAHKDGVSSVAWLDSDRVISAGGDGAVKVWKLEGFE